MPLAVQLSGLGFNLLSRFSNEHAARLLTRLWFTTFKNRPREWVADFWRSAERRVEVPVEDTRITVHGWGSGPLVVLMHGWSGSGSQFNGFVDPLVASGLSVACFDAPEHGAESGRPTHIRRFIASLLAIQRELGPVDCVVAHSMGAMATCYALQAGLQSSRAVLIAPQLDAGRLFDGYRDLLRLRPRLAERARALIETRLRELLARDDAWQALGLDGLIAGNMPPGLLICDRDDPEVPLEHFDDIERLWRDCRKIETHGQGHNRILRDAGVIASVATYLER